MEVDHASHGEVADSAGVDPPVAPGVLVDEGGSAVVSQLVVLVAGDVDPIRELVADGCLHQSAHHLPDVREPLVQLLGVDVRALLDVLQHLGGVHSGGPFQVNPSQGHALSSGL